MSNCTFAVSTSIASLMTGEHLADCSTVNNWDMVEASQKEYLHGQYSVFMLYSFRQVATGYEAIDDKPHQ